MSFLLFTWAPDRAGAGCRGPMRGGRETQALKSGRKEQFSTGFSSAGTAAPGSSAVPGTHKGDVSPQRGSARARLGQRDVSHFQSHFGGISPGNSSFPPEYRWGWKGLCCCWEEEEGAAFPEGMEVRAQYLTPEDLTVVVVTHLRTEEEPPPAMKLPPAEPHILPLPEEKPPLRIPPPTPQLPPMTFPLPTTHTPPPLRPLLAPKLPDLPPDMVVLPTTAGREGEAH